MDKTKILIEEFFTEILGDKPDIVIDQSDEEILVDLQLNPELSGVVIGYRGEVLTALQLILSLMIQTDQENWLPVRVNVNNYREQREEALENLARNTADRVLHSGQAMSLPNLSSYERRIIHNILSEIDGIESYSEGEGRNRVLIIAPFSTENEL